jgi:5-formyltetrahydrofolate cyclo-ligase
MENKSDIRRRGRVIRAEIGDEPRAELDRLIIERAQDDLDWSAYLRVMTFLPIARQREIDTWPLVRWIWANWPRIQMYVPRAEGEVMVAHRLSPDTMLAENRWGIPEPVESMPLMPDERLELIIVPLLGFDGKGHRVGYGHGYYDRFLSEHAPARLVGLGYQALLVPDGIKAEPHDVKMSEIITEKEHYWFAKHKKAV